MGYLYLRESKGGSISDAEISALIKAVQKRDVRRIRTALAFEWTKKEAKNGADPGKYLGLGFRYVDLERTIASGDKVIFANSENQFDSSQRLTIEQAIKIVESRSNMPFTEFRRLNGSNLKEQQRYDRKLYWTQRTREAAAEGAEARDLLHTSYGQWFGDKINVFKWASKGMDWLAHKAGEYAANKYGAEFSVDAEKVLADSEVQDEIRKASARLNIPVQALAVVATIVAPELTIPMLIANYAPTAMTAIGAITSTGKAREKAKEELIGFIQGFNPAQENPLDAALAVVNLLSLKSDGAALKLKRVTGPKGGLHFDSDAAGKPLADGSFRLGSGHKTFRINQETDSLFNAPAVVRDVVADAKFRKIVAKTPGLSEDLKEQYRSSLQDIDAEQADAAVKQLDMISRTGAARTGQTANDWLINRLTGIRQGGELPSKPLFHVPAEFTTASKSKNEGIVHLGRGYRNSKQQVIDYFETAKERHPQPFADSDSFEEFSSEYLMNQDGLTLRAPQGLIDIYKNPKQILMATQAQWHAAEDFVKHAIDLRTMYRGGLVDPSMSAQLALSAIASRRRPPAVSEAAMVHLSGPELRWIIDRVLSGRATRKNIEDFRRWSYDATRGLPGASAIHNVNVFTDDFLSNLNSPVRWNGQNSTLADHWHQILSHDSNEEAMRQLLAILGKGLGPKTGGFAGMYSGQLQPVAIDANWINSGWTNTVDGRKAYPYLNAFFQGRKGVLLTEAFRRSFDPVARRVLSGLVEPSDALLLFDQLGFQKLSGNTTDHAGHLGLLTNRNRQGVTTSPFRKSGNMVVSTHRGADGVKSYIVKFGDGQVSVLNQDDYLNMRRIIKDDGTFQGLSNGESGGNGATGPRGPEHNEPSADGGFYRNEPGTGSDGRGNLEGDEGSDPNDGHQFYTGPGGRIGGAFSVDPDSQRALIQLFQGANAASLPHEIGHFIRHKWLDGRDLERVERALGVKNGKWTRAAEERFAQMHEEYLRIGKSPNKELAAVFAKFRKWLDEVYGALRFESNRDVRRILDKAYGRTRFDWNGLLESLNDVRSPGASAATKEYRDRRSKIDQGNAVLLDGGLRLRLSPDEYRQFRFAR